MPKPDSPCLYLPENTGPDGCAIFYKKEKFDLEKWEKRVIQVWHVESNQVIEKWPLTQLIWLYEIIIFWYNQMTSFKVQ